MQYKLPSDNKPKLNPFGVLMVRAAVARTAKLVIAFVTSSPLVSSDDKRRITGHLYELTKSINDIAQRSPLHEVSDAITSDSSDDKMAHYLRMETDTLQGIIQSTLHIVDRLHVTNRMSDAQYRRVQKYFKSVVGMHSALLKKLVTSTE
jgi:hypothetical protein